jgi:hypothetical protein
MIFFILFPSFVPTECASATFRQVNAAPEKKVAWFRAVRVNMIR